jgi:hypothetical protein
MFRSCIRALLCCLHVTANGAVVDEWDSEPEIECDGRSARSGSSSFTLRLPHEWPLQLRLLLLRKHSEGHLTAFFEDVSYFYPSTFDDAVAWPWPPPVPFLSSTGLQQHACGVLHLIDTTFTYGCAVANYSGCSINAGVERGACGSHLGMDDVMRFLHKQENKYVLVNDRCSQSQSHRSSLDAQQLLMRWSGVNAHSLCADHIKSAERISPVVTLFTDYMVARAHDLRRLYPAEILGVWLVEPRSICPSCYQYVVDHAASFDVVLSHDIQFLSDIRLRHPNGSAAAFFVPFASSFLPPPFMGLHKEIKSKLVSCFVSNKRMLIGHVLRHAVYNDARLRKRVQFYGQGAGHEIDHKVDAMAPYMFHIVIENSRARSYYSEKLIDCFLSGTIPLYWGGNLPAAFERSGVITWNTLEDLVLVVSSLSAEEYWSRHGSVVRNYDLALSCAYTGTLQAAWSAYLLPLASTRARQLELGLAEANRLFQNAIQRRSDEHRAFVSDAASAVLAAFGGSANRLSSVHFWIVVYVDATMTIPRLKRCLEQLQLQTVSSWRAILVVDSSAYESQDHRSLLESQSDHRITLSLSFERCKTKLDCILLALNASYSLYDESVDPICFFLYGRDSLLSSESLARIADLYTHLNCWVTYGSSVLSPSMTLEASRDASAAVDDHFFPVHVYERNTARTSEWLNGRYPFFTLLRSIMHQIPASHSRIPDDEGDPGLAILVAAVELAGDRVVPLIHVVHERWTSRSFWDAAAGGSELFHVQDAWKRRERIMQLPVLRRLRGARMLPESSLNPKVSMVVKGGLFQPPGTTEASISVSASGLWIPEEATLQFLVDGEEIPGVSDLYSFVFKLPTVYGHSWQLQARLLSTTISGHVMVEESVLLEIDDDL